MVLYNEPMKDHITFRVGGPAKVFVQPEDIDELIGVIRECTGNHENYIVIGNGSNIIFSDEGFDGTVIDVSGYLKNYRIDDSSEEIKATAQAGVLLSRLGNELAKRAVTGFEFATGIPGCIGGAVAMNAGAYGGEMKDCLKEVKVYLPQEDKITTFSVAELDMGYRTSRIQKEKMIVLEAEFSLKKGNAETIKATLSDLAGRRRDKQPLEFPSAGSTFKRPQGDFAGRLIEEAGLKGYSVGGMQVSPKHAGFVVNTGNGTFKDFMDLTGHIKAAVKEKFGVDLELEVKIIDNN
ncbi:MAG: UDP-N-acetylmuramate dehydrogenase [Lachnospiraceae bacterium]